MKKLIIAALGVALGAASLNASAVTDVGGNVTLHPSLELTSLCTVTVVDTAITAYATKGDANVYDVNNIGTITVNGCTADYKIGADGGANYSSGRQLKEPTLTKYIPYKLGIAKSTGTATATDITSATGWGTTGMTVTGGVAATGNALTVSSSVLTDVVFTVSAKFSIPVAATAPIGTYEDTVMIGVEF